MNFGEYARFGEHHDVMEALTLLTKAYINMCGYSLGYRTVVYCAIFLYLKWQGKNRSLP